MTCPTITLKKCAAKPAWIWRSSSWRNHGRTNRETAAGLKLDFISTMNLNDFLGKPQGYWQLFHISFCIFPVWFLFWETCRWTTKIDGAWCTNFSFPLMPDAAYPCRLELETPNDTQLGEVIYPSDIPWRSNLLGGDWNMTFIFPYIGNIHPNWLIFFRRVQTTNQ